MVYTLAGSRVVLSAYGGMAGALPPNKDGLSANVGPLTANPVLQFTEEGEEKKFPPKNCAPLL
jgi:hypothetical protein